MAVKFIKDTGQDFEIGQEVFVIDKNSQYFNQEAVITDKFELYLYDHSTGSKPTGAYIYRISIDGSVNNYSKGQLCLNTKVEEISADEINNILQ